MEGYGLLILLTLIGFLALAALLLTPVYRFLEREEKISRKWTEEKLAERLRERQSASNGTSDSAASSTDE